MLTFPETHVKRYKQNNLRINPVPSMFASKKKKTRTRYCTMKKSSIRCTTILHGVWTFRWPRSSQSIFTIANQRPTRVSNSNFIGVNARKPSKLLATRESLFLWDLREKKPRDVQFALTNYR